MNRLKLRTLAVTNGKDTHSEIKFSETVTVIYGRSNTGKTYIRDLIDYILGSGEALRKLKEAEKYNFGCLEIENQGRNYTLIRNLRGGEILLSEIPYDQINFESLDGEGFQKLSVKHGTFRGSVSAFFLSLIGMENIQILNDATFTEGSLKSLSLRALVKLFLITEKQIIETTPPILSAAEITERTLLKTLFTYLMTGTDYSNAILSAPIDQVKEARAAGRRETLKNLVKEFRQARKVKSRSILLKDLEKGNKKVEDLQLEIGNLRESLGDLESQRIHLVVERRGLNDKIVFVTNQLERFTILHQSYLSDLERLDGVIDAAATLDKLGAVNCPVCGAAACYQTKHSVFDVTALIEACSAEAKKVHALESDLKLAMRDNQTEQDISKKQIQANTVSLSHVEERIQILEKMLASEKIRELENAVKARQDTRSDLEYLNSIENVRSKYSVMLNVDNEDDESSSPVAQMDIMPSTVVMEKLAQEVKSLLEAWKFTNENGSVHIDQEGEIIVDGVMHRDCGKGVRAIYHAAFTIGLMNVCLKNNLPHPGFVVIDSPTTSHKGDNIALPDEEIPDENRRAFYHSLESVKSQIVIIDNYGPSSTSPLTTYYFEKGRGFL
jgi:hypothetical protein